MQSVNILQLFVSVLLKIGDENIRENLPEGSKVREMDFTSQDLYFGGVPSHIDISGLNISSVPFVGCMDQVVASHRAVGGFYIDLRRGFYRQMIVGCHPEVCIMV